MIAPRHLTLSLLCLPVAACDSGPAAAPSTRVAAESADDCGGLEQALAHAAPRTLPVFADRYLAAGCDPEPACTALLEDRLIVQGDSPDLSRAIITLGCLQPVGDV